MGAEPRTFLTHLACTSCGRRLDFDRPQNVCGCGSPVLAEYDLDGVARSLSKEDLPARPASMWRYGELLPVGDRGNVVSLGEGFTPLLPVPERAGRRWGLPGLLVKDEGTNPTGTFKARGASCGISRAVELGIREVALSTAGNAGGAWACYGAAAGVRVHVAMPRDAPDVNRLECELFGASVTLVDGLISDAGRVVAEGVRRLGWFDVSTLKEPYRIEGKKTLGLEIAEQLGWRMPDAVVYPAGGGVGIIGIWRGLSQLRELGWVDGDLPRLSIVQSEGCAPIVRAFDAGAEASEPWEGADTIAAGLRVPKALGDSLVLRAIRETGGSAVAVSDDAILEAMGELARHAGVLAAPEGAATLAGALALRERGDLRPGDRAVLVQTGSAMKYPHLLERVVGEAREA
ncbi:MAG TPA: threonine synthase [Actinomycetota bacterium]|nr:threonine synthase [Actinomycetota bacterium]